MSRDMPPIFYPFMLSLRLVFDESSSMRYLNWLFRIVLFLLLLGFAVKNDQPVTLSYFFGYQWTTPLVVVSLCFFALGAGIGILAMLGTVFRQRKELAATRHELQLRSKLDKASEVQRFPVQPS